MELLEEWHNRTGTEIKVLKKYLGKLKRSKSKYLNGLADELHSRVFKEINCLECANCCWSIPPIINEMDVKRAAKFLGIRPMEFKDRYVRLDEDLDMIINNSPCPFLLDDNKCKIYYGRPRACREYPHTDNFEFTRHIRIHEKNLDYCPAVYHIVKVLRLKA